MFSIEIRGVEKVTTLIRDADFGSQRTTRIVRDVTSRLSQYLASINPVDTGAMRDSWTWTTVGPIGKVYISLSSYNPRSGHPVIEYAPYVDDRYGLIERAVVQGERIATEALDAVTWEPR